MLVFACAFIVASLLGWGLTWGVIPIAHRAGFLDVPDRTRKKHARPTPLLGGVAICLTLLAGTLLFGLAFDLGNVVRPSAENFLPALLVSTVALCLVGLYDDKHGMRARTKLLFQTLAILPFVLWGRSVTSGHLLGFNFDLSTIGLPLTLLWLVACTNFINLIDGLDGLAGSVTLIVCSAVGILSWLNGQPEVCLVATVLSGSLVGFLLHNRPPARIFLGDSGSLPLGFLVGALSVEASMKRAAGLTLVVPLALLCIPMFDTVMAIVRRKLTGRKIGQGDYAHIHHCLRERGLSPEHTLLTIASLCALTAVGAVAGAVFENDVVSVGCTLGIVIGLIVTRLFGFRETQLLVNQVRTTWSVLAELPNSVQQRMQVQQLLEASMSGLASPKTLDDIIAIADRLQLSSLEFAFESPDGDVSHPVILWQRPGEILQADALWEYRCALPRENGYQAVILVRGPLAQQQQLPLVTQFLRLLDTVCATFPAEEGVAPAVSELSEAPGSRRELHEGPHTLRGPHGIWPVRAGGDEETHSVTELEPRPRAREAA